MSDNNDDISKAQPEGSSRSNVNNGDKSDAGSAQGLTLQGAASDTDGDAQKKTADFKTVIRSFYQFIIALMNIKDDTDYKGSTDQIRGEIDFQGYNVWVLICSILIASIGLNQDSTAVVIGAMLISPLMGPIVGAGLAIGTNDLKMLVRSLKSFGVAVGVAILTSYIYFLITPLSFETSELLGRTSPTVLDAVIAFFGGLAGIIAVTRREKTNVIPGVAIATALMPPLCTAGYGLAHGNTTYFFGAMYLFLLNSGFIWLTSFIAVRYLNFPMKSFPDAKRERRVKMWILIVSVLIVVPSTWSFINVVRESRFRQSAENFIKEVCTYNGARIQKGNLVWNPDSSVIEIYTSVKRIPYETEVQWRSMLPKYDLTNTHLVLEQSAIDLSALYQPDDNDDGISSEVYNELWDDTKKLQVLTDKLNKQVSDYKAREYDVRKISRYIAVHYPKVERISHGFNFSIDTTNKIDTVFTLSLSWQDKVSKAEKEEATVKMMQYLRLELNRDTVAVVSN